MQFLIFIVIVFLSQAYCELGSFLNCLTSSSCTITKEHLIKFFSHLDEKNEHEPEIQLVAYLINHRITLRKASESNSELVKVPKIGKLARLFRRGQYQISLPGVKMFIPSHYYQYEDIAVDQVDLSQDISISFMTIELPSMLSTVTSKKVYFSLKELYFMVRNPIIQHTTHEIFTDEGIGLIIAGLAHPSVYHSLKMEHIEIILDKMSEYDQDLNIDTLYILFRNRISIGRDHPSEVTTLNLLESLSIRPDASKNTHVFSILLYLIDEARKDDGVNFRREHLLDRISNLINCSNDVIFGPSILFLLNKITRFDIMINFYFGGIISSSNENILSLQLLEKLFWNNNTELLRNRLVLFLASNSGSFLPYSEISASFAIICHFLFNSTEEELKRIIFTYFRIKEEDPHEIREGILNISLLLTYIISKYESILIDSFYRSSGILETLALWTKETENVLKTEKTLPKYSVVDENSKSCGRVYSACDIAFPSLIFSALFMVLLEL